MAELWSGLTAMIMMMMMMTCNDNCSSFEWYKCGLLKWFMHFSSCSALIEVWLRADECSGLVGMTVLRVCAAHFLSFTQKQKYTLFCMVSSAFGHESVCTVYHSAGKTCHTALWYHFLRKETTKMKSHQVAVSCPFFVLLAYEMFFLQNHGAAWDECVTISTHTNIESSESQYNR